MALKVIVTAHAQERYRQRKRVNLPGAVIKAQIEKEVREAAGLPGRQVLPYKPRAWRLWGETKASAQLAPDQRFVGDPNGDHAYLVRVESGGTWTVLTTLTRTVRRSGASAGDVLRPEDAEAYPVGSPKWLALSGADVDALRDRDQ